MKTLGEKIFARDSAGRLLSRIGTIFFRTPGLVTKRGVHAMQRVMWLEEVNRELAAAGKAPLTEAEEDEEMLESVDLIFTDDQVLIRPDPDRMDLAVRADLELQKLVPKRLIRFLNTSSAKVRHVLMERGENWRMARHPISQEDMAKIIEGSRVAIAEKTVYYYNGATGTRFITASGYAEIAKLPDEEYRRQVEEVVKGLSKRNRLGHPEVDIFPVTAPVEIRKSLASVALDELSDTELRRCVDKIVTDWRIALPAELREETVENYDWRNTMCFTLTRSQNDPNAEEQELVSGISPEFYRQIEWLPGARIDRGEVVFDELWDEAERTRDPESLELCDGRVKSLIFNLTRLFGAIAWINVGRIARSLARHPEENSRRGNVYIVQYLEEGAAEPRILMIRFQKWGVAERLDEGKDLVRAMTESDEYSDYILDRRLMCRQLGMKLPRRIGYGHFTEKYHGDNAYSGRDVRTAYFVRPYIRGVASDKIPVARFRNPAFANAFARLMGAAAALDLIVGRRSTATGSVVFDNNYETLVMDAEGLPVDLAITDHEGTFNDYEGDLVAAAALYAEPVRRRQRFVTAYPQFAAAYVEAFGAKFAEVQATYRERRRAFDELFKDRPFDVNGSGAYRWASVLRRLDAADPAVLKARLREAIGC